MDSSDLQKIRHHLHSIAELSGSERSTADFIISTMKQFHPTTIITKLAGQGVVVVFDSAKPGPSVVFRAELDGLPLQENTGKVYSSKKPNISHLCGHDGHMTILIGLADFISRNLTKMKGKAMLLFQPAEETAQGAKDIIKDTRFLGLQPTHCFALHNLPGYEQATVIVKKDVFTWASIGVKIFLHGKSSHAGHPEEGNSPLPAMIHLVQLLEQVVLTNKEPKKDLITIIHMCLGDISFGTTPGDGVVMATLRACSDEHLETVKSSVESVVSEITKQYQIKITFEWVEYFPSITNNDACVDIVLKAARKKNLSVINLQHPFRWTEDFSFYCRVIPSCYCGIGSGKGHPPLHAATYDFADEIIGKGITLFSGVIEHLLYE